MYRGQKISGDGRGKELGFPTVNIKLSQCDMGKIFSQHTEGGVFLVHFFWAGKKIKGLLHLGPRPTFHSKELRVEIFLLDFSEDIPENESVHFEIKSQIRAIKKFSSPEALIAQITEDVERAKKL